MIMLLPVMSCQKIRKSGRSTWNPPALTSVAALTLYSL